MITGTDIREARNRAAMSQEALAVAVGVTLRTIGNWERSATVPRNKEPILRTVLGDHLDAGEASSPRLRSSSNEELLSEIARRLTRARQEEGSEHGNSSDEKSDDDVEVAHGEGTVVEVDETPTQPPALGTDSSP